MLQHSTPNGELVENYSTRLKFWQEFTTKKVTQGHFISAKI